MKPLDRCHLYTFIDAAYLHARSPESVVEQLCQGGADLIQLRAKDWNTDQIQETAQRLLPITTSADVGLVINDFPQVALAVGAPICHLGQEDFFYSGHSKRIDHIQFNRGLILGLSSHAPDEALRAVAAGADYLAIGPVFTTRTKPDAKPVTCDYVRWAAGHLSLPWFAIGGINLENLGEVLEAGATRICVVSAILNSPDVASACHEFKVRLMSPHI